MSNSRVYHLEDAGRRVLVRAVSSAQATSFLARKKFPCRVATQDDMEAVLSSGGRVHDATDPNAPAVPDAPPAGPVAAVPPVASIAMSGVTSPADVMRHLSSSATPAGADPASAANELATAAETLFAKTQGG